MPYTNQNSNTTNTRRQQEREQLPTKPISLFNSMSFTPKLAHQPRKFKPMLDFSRSKSGINRVLKQNSLIQSNHGEENILIRKRSPPLPLSVELNQEFHPFALPMALRLSSQPVAKTNFMALNGNQTTNTACCN
jgi:hypothetical protein